MAQKRKQKKKVDRKKASASQKRRVWSPEQQDILAAMYTSETWEALLKAFPNHTRAALQSQANRQGLKRPKRTEGSAGKEGRQGAKNVPPTEEQIASFMTCGRSVDEIAKKFNLSRDDAQAWIDGGLKGYELFVSPKNLRGEQTYVAVPRIGNTKVADRVWTFARQVNEDPYGVIHFPDDYIHQKIKIVPIDSILFGDDAHDKARFDNAIRKISRAPNTFCFLNGDIIAHVTRGKKDVKEQVLLERCVEFEKKMAPIAHKILWAQQGCLEERSLRSQGFDPLQHFCARFGIPYFDEPVYIDLVWKGHIFTFWAMHGHSTAQLKGSKMNALRRPATHHEYTHFIVMGHVGDAMWNRQPKLVRDPVKGAIVAREEFHVILPNFKKYFGTKEARRGYSPSSNNDIVCYLYPNGEHHVKTMSSGRST